MTKNYFKKYKILNLLLNSLPVLKMHISVPLTIYKARAFILFTFLLLRGIKNDRITPTDSAKFGFPINLIDLKSKVSFKLSKKLEIVFKLINNNGIRILK